MEDAQDDGACKGRYRSRIFIVRSFGASARGSTSSWPQIADRPKLDSSCTTAVIAREADS
jgi:hypothetical protein